MLGTLKNIFQKNTDQENVDSDFYDPEPTNNPNFLTDTTKIHKLLKDIEEASPLCTIIIDGATEEFSSSILDVQIENNQIIIDELLPKPGNETLVREKKLKLSTIFNGIRLAFKLTDIKPGSSRGIAYYKATLPDRIYYPQRRSSLRIQISSLNLPFSGTSNRTQTTIGGQIFDLSRGGIGIVTQNNRARFQRGDSIKNCRITINGQAIIFDLTVRFVKTNSGTGKTQIGGYLENISTKGQNKLEHFVASLEREEIRKRKE